MAYKKTNNKTATYGEQSNSVMELQKQLNAKGASLAVDGKYGDLTKAAFNKFNATTPPTQNPSAIPIEAITNTPKPMELASNAPVNNMKQNFVDQALSVATSNQENALAQSNKGASDMTDIMSFLGTEGAAKAKAQEASGVGDMEARSRQLESLAYGEVMNLNSNILTNRTNAIGTRETSNFLGAQEERMRNNAAVNAMTYSAEAAILKGNIETANARIDSAIKSVYDPKKVELEIAKFNLDRIDKNLLTPAQQALAKATDRKLDTQQKEIEKKQDFAEGLLKNGATPSIIKDILNSDSIEEAMVTPGIQKYMQSPLERAQLEKIRADISNMNSISSPGLTLKERASLLKDPTSKKAVASIQLVKALDDYATSMTKFKTTREKTTDNMGRSVKGGNFFGGDLSRQEKAASEQLIDSMIAPALSLAQQQGVIQAGEAEGYKKKLKVARLKGAKYVPAIASQIIQAVNTQIQNDFDFIDSSIPGATDSYQIFAEYKNSLLPNEELLNTGQPVGQFGESVYSINQ